MARFKSYLLVVIGFAFAGAIGVAFGTGTAQAVVSTLVSVVNPTTSPVPSLNVTDPGRIPYQSAVDNLAKCSNQITCTFSFPTVPSGHRVVVEHISGFLSLTAIPTRISALITTPVGSGISSISPQGANVGFDQPVLFYVDASNSVTIEVIIAGGALFEGNGSSNSLTLIGYELDCTVAACAPIATQ
jgi:hypothetical protein